MGSGSFPCLSGAIIVVKDSTLDTVVQRLQFPYFHSQAALPEGLGQLVWPVANRLSLIMSAVGTFGLFVGWLALVLAILQVLGRLDTAVWLASRSLLVPAMMLCGFWLGYLARLAVYARFELRHANSQIVFAQHMLSVAGLCALAAIGAGSGGSLVGSTRWHGPDSCRFLPVLCRHARARPQTTSDW